MISLLKSRTGLRYYLFRGLALSVLLVCGIFLSGTWQIYRTGLQTLPKDAHADAAVVLGAAAWDKRPSPVFRERINMPSRSTKAIGSAKSFSPAVRPKKDL